MNYTNEAWEEEQMSNLGCESVSDLIEEVKRLREQIRLLHDTWFADAEMASDVDERMTELLRYDGGEEE